MAHVLFVMLLDLIVPTSDMSSMTCELCWNFFFFVLLEIIVMLNLIVLLEIIVMLEVFFIPILLVVQKQKGHGKILIFVFYSYRKYLSGTAWEKFNFRFYELQ